MITNLRIWRKTLNGIRLLPCHRLSGTDLVSLVTIELVCKLGLSLKDLAFLAVYVPVELLAKVQRWVPVSFPTASRLGTSSKFKVHLSDSPYVGIQNTTEKREQHAHSDEIV